MEILEKRLSPAVQNHYADLENTCRDKVTKFSVIVRYTKKVVEKNEGWGHIWPQVAVWGLNMDTWTVHDIQSSGFSMHCILKPTQNLNDHENDI